MIDPLRDTIFDAGRARRLRIRKLVLGVFFGIPLIFIAISLDVLLRQVFEARHRIMCANNIKQIGLAIELYCHESHGDYPPDFGTLLKSEGITTSAFICPGEWIWIPSGMTTEQAARWVDQNSSYTYLGARMTDAVDAGAIVAYESEDTHHRDVNVLYADGHVENEKLAYAKAQVARQQTVNPDYSR